MMPFRQQRWAKNDPRLSNRLLHHLTPTCTRLRPAPTDYMRRQALGGNPNVLVAQALASPSMNFITIYRGAIPG